MVISVLAVTEANSPPPYTSLITVPPLIFIARELHKLQNKGIEIGIISWLSKSGTDEYNERVTVSKMKWLKKHLPSVVWNEIHIVSYGTPKSTCGNGILFDDEEPNRKEWNGISYDVHNIIEILRAF